MPDPQLHSLTGARAACPPKQHTAHAHLRTAAGRPGRVPCLRKWLARRRAGATRCLHRSARSAQQEVGGSGWSPRPAREARVTLPAGGRSMHVGVDSAWSGSSASVTHPGTCARPASWHLDRTWSALIEEHCSARWLYLHQSTTKALTQVHVHGLLLGIGAPVRVAERVALLPAPLVVAAEVVEALGVPAAMRRRQRAVCTIGGRAGQMRSKEGKAEWLSCWECLWRGRQQ